MDRIKQSDLEYYAGLINQATNSPQDPYHTDENNQNRANIGNYHISGAYSGKSLHRMCNEHGGVSDVFSCGHIPRRDLYNRMRAYLSGLEEMEYIFIKKEYK